MNSNDTRTDDAIFDPNDWFDLHIEAYIDGALPPDEMARFTSMLEASEACQHEVILALEIRDELRAIPTPECPPGVTLGVLRAARKSARRAAWQGFYRRHFGLQAAFWKPALAVVALLVAITWLFAINRAQPTVSSEISEAEVEQALAEVKWALGYVSKTGRMAGDTVHDALAPALKELPSED